MFGKKVFFSFFLSFFPIFAFASVNSLESFSLAQRNSIENYFLSYQYRHIDGVGAFSGGAMLNAPPFSSCVRIVKKANNDADRAIKKILSIKYPGSLHSPNQTVPLLYSSTQIAVGSVESALVAAVTYVRALSIDINTFHNCNWDTLPCLLYTSPSPRDS